MRQSSTSAVIAAALLAAVGVLAALQPTLAAMPAGPHTTPVNGDELIVFESEACIHCALFRRDVLPDYLRSRRGRSLPIRFVDAHRSGARRAQLRAPLAVVPTFVLIRRGREVGRISGYTGPGLFFPLVNQMVRSADQSRNGF